MKYHFHVLSPDDSRLTEYRAHIDEYWKLLWLRDDSGGTTWDVLEEIGQQVTDNLLRGEPEDILRALALTAKAEYLQRAGDERN